MGWIFMYYLSLELQVVSYDINKFLNLTNFYFENAFLLHDFHCCTHFVWNGLFAAIFHFSVVLPRNDSSSSWKMLWWPRREALAGISSVFNEIFILTFLRSNQRFCNANKITCKTKLMPFPFTLKEHAPVLSCLSSVYWATINTSND